MIVLKAVEIEKKGVYKIDTWMVENSCSGVCFAMKVGRYRNLKSLPGL